MIRNRRILRLLAVFIFLSGLSPLPASAETENERVEQIKSAFILNIARFVSWPTEALDHQRNELLLCLYRLNPLGEAIGTISGKMVNGRVLRQKLVSSLEQSQPCNILLVGGTEMQHFIREAQHGPKSPLLTIADLTVTDELPAQQPALVALVRKGARIGFEINLAKTHRVGLQMSSNLLKLAKITGDDK